jgi:hypothetical protein
VEETGEHDNNPGEKPVEPSDDATAETELINANTSHRY